MHSTILIGSRPAYKCPVARVLKCSSVWVAAISLGPVLAIPADWARPRVCPMVRLFRWERQSAAAWLPSYIRQTCRYLQLRNLQHFSLNSRHTSGERYPRGAPPVCGLAEKATTADSTAFIRWAMSGSSSPAKEHSSVLCPALRQRSHRVAFLAFPVKQTVYNEGLILDHACGCCLATVCRVVGLPCRTVVFLAGP